ncbi:MAG: hypothetical protein JWM27_4795 [Gemmatimonadetes bacterium]|nr:hypothetical protein [Gemmatimonadota bacterium]
MRKLTLQPESLQVESFVMDHEPADRGTVHAHDSRITEFCKTWNCPYTYGCGGGTYTCQAHDGDAAANEEGRVI